MKAGKIILEGGDRGDARLQMEVSGIRVKIGNAVHLVELRTEKPGGGGAHWKVEGIYWLVEFTCAPASLGGDFCTIKTLVLCDCANMPMDRRPPLCAQNVSRGRKTPPRPLLRAHEPQNELTCCKGWSTYRHCGRNGECGVGIRSGW